MKRTLIVATTSYAGMGPYVSEIVNTFSPEDEVYYLFHDYEDDFFKKNIKAELHSKSVFYKKPNSNWNKLLSLIFGNRKFDRLVIDLCQRHKAQCVHYINCPVPICVDKRLKKMGVKSLGTVHDLHPHESKKAPHKLLRSMILAKRIHESMDYNTNLVTNGMAQHEELKQMYPQKDIFFHAFPSLVSHEVANGHDVPPELQNLDKPYILFFGRIEEYKGVHYLYNVFTSTPELNVNYYLAIAGKGDLGFVRKKDEKGVIWLHRYIKDSEVRYMYENAKCVVYPYISATQSGVLSLAYYFQTPVLASDVPFFKSSIEPTGAGVTFRANDIFDLKNKLIDILKADVKEIKIAESKYYQTNYDGQSIHTALTNIYDSLNLRIDTHLQYMGGKMD